MNRQPVIVVQCHVAHGIVQNQKYGIDPVVDPDPGLTNQEKTNERNIHSINVDDTVGIEVIQDIVGIAAEIGVENEIDVHHHESIAVINQMRDEDTMIDQKN